MDFHWGMNADREAGHGNHYQIFWRALISFICILIAVLSFLYPKAVAKAVMKFLIYGKY